MRQIGYFTVSTATIEQIQSCIDRHSHVVRAGFFQADSFELSESGSVIILKTDESLIDSRAGTIAGAMLALLVDGVTGFVKSEVAP